MINFTRAFDSAWERMHIILFRPFDFGKWLAIGLSAFLAGLLEGGNGFNSSFNTNGFSNNDAFNKLGGTNTPKIDWNQINTQVNHAMGSLQAGIVVLLVLVFVVFVFGVLFLIYWLGARGQFMLLDNIVRNRGAVAGPWHYYARQANSLFGFYLLLMVISFAILIPILVVAVLMIIPLIQHHRWPEGGEIAGFVVLGLVYLTFAIAMGLVLFVFREFGVPMMFRQGLLARPAFFEAMHLIRQHPGSVVVFVLLRMAIFIGVAVLSVIICCATCCIGMLPYLGTVILLPVIIYVRCFTLDCLAQFGPQYDVWTVDVPPAGTAGMIPPPFSPRPPLG